MRLERHGGFFMSVLLGMWITGNLIHYIVDVNEPNNILVEQARKDIKDSEPLHNDGGLYAEVLEKMKTCTSNTEPGTSNKFYLCPNNEKITQIYWDRDNKSRQGIVTRYYDSNGKLRLIYGHPDDR